MACGCLDRISWGHLVGVSTSLLRSVLDTLERNAVSIRIRWRSLGRFRADRAYGLRAPRAWPPLRINRRDAMLLVSEKADLVWSSPGPSGNGSSVHASA